jgi:hypothetical protein
MKINNKITAILAVWKRDQISKNARKWYIKNCRFELWKENMKKVVKNGI